MEKESLASCRFWALWWRKAGIHDQELWKAKGLPDELQCVKIYPNAIPTGDFNPLTRSNCRIYAQTSEIVWMWSPFIQHPLCTVWRDASWRFCPWPWCCCLVFWSFFQWTTYGKHDCSWTDPYVRSLSLQGWLGQSTTSRMQWGEFDVQNWSILFMVIR